ncbi:hypothetical protein LG634_24895 [Streptomyces bambusae]|uniref:hypothetical protein n=1 Tax=Streptomyces bambusae TaxID=1550616 RepID=UPI001CFCB115|nr:hypothetical protein [Streptomyces bambusae]MCB5168052.1 hypothetical protein [Streptomyces bambusae]
MSALTRLRAATRVELAVLGVATSAWRAVHTGIEDQPNAVGPVCADDDHDPDDPSLYDCCPNLVIELGTESEALAGYLAALLTADLGGAR